MKRLRQTGEMRLTRINGRVLFVYPDIPCLHEPFSLQRTSNIIDSVRHLEAFYMDCDNYWFFNIHLLDLYQE